MEGVDYRGTWSHGALSSRVSREMKETCAHESWVNLKFLEKSTNLTRRTSYCPHIFLKREIRGKVITYPWWLLTNFYVKVHWQMKGILRVCVVVHSRSVVDSQFEYRTELEDNSVTIISFQDVKNLIYPNPADASFVFIPLCSAKY